MIVNMPFGTVIINSQEDAARFVSRYCCDCDKNNLMNPCSGAQSARCQEKIKQVINYFKGSNKND